MSKNKNRHSKQKQGVKPDTKPDNPITVKPDDTITEKHIIKPNAETKIVNVDKDDNLVLTKEDKKRLEVVKALQAKAKQANIDAKDAKAKAIEAIQSLEGSEAIKAIKQDIEARLKTQETATSKALEEYQKAKEALQAIQSEYQSLTGIDKAVKKASKSKTGNGNGNGKFETVVKQEADSISVLVTHKATKSLFEYSLYPSNGSIKRQDWLKLRHSLTAQFERETKEENLTIRAYLSNLKSKIEEVKAIV